MDGWEEEDNPITEHLKHSPDCAWAIIMDIQQSSSNPSMIDDPTSDRITQARRGTFGTMWPHDGKRGWHCQSEKVLSLHSGSNESTAHVHDRWSRQGGTSALTKRAMTWLAAPIVSCHWMDGSPRMILCEWNDCSFLLKTNKLISRRSVVTNTIAAPPIAPSLYSHSSQGRRARDLRPRRPALPKQAPDCQLNPWRLFHLKHLSKRWARPWTKA